MKILYKNGHSKHFWWDDYRVLSDMTTLFYTHKQIYINIKNTYIHLYIYIYLYYIHKYDYILHHPIRTKKDMATSEVYYGGIWS